MDDLARDVVDERMGASLARLGEYFMGKSPLQLAAEALAERLDALEAEYAVGGALAVNYHGVMRATEDVDVLKRPEVQRAVAVFFSAARRLA